MTDLILKAGERYVRRDGKVTGPLFHDSTCRWFCTKDSRALYAYDGDGTCYGSDGNAQADIIARWPGDDYYESQCAMIASGAYRFTVLEPSQGLPPAPPQQLKGDMFVKAQIDLSEGQWDAIWAALLALEKEDTNV